jgi:hypothetical protein
VLVLRLRSAVGREVKKLEKKDNRAGDTKRARGERRVLGFERSRPAGSAEALSAGVLKAQPPQK